MTHNTGVLKWVIWVLAAFFYFYEYVLRVSPSVMVPELMNAFHVDATTLGLLTSFFFYAYAPMQLPVGLLIDRFGARRLLTFASVICGLGAILFGVSSYLLQASLGRLLVGFGASFGFVAMVYVCSHWFPKSKRALLVGLANSIGMLGAFCGQGPLGVALHAVNWRVALILLGVTGFLLAFLIYFIVEKEKFQELVHKNIYKTLLSGLKDICKNRHAWINAFIALFIYVTTSAVADLWGVPFLQSAYHLSKQAAAFAISMIFIGWLVGGPIIGWASDFLKKRIRIIAFSIIFTLISLSAVVYLTNMPLPIVYILLFFVGFFSSGELLNFTVATELSAPHVKGSAIAFTNCIVSFGSGFIQPIVGMVLDLSWNGAQENGINLYSAKAYQWAFLILPVFLCVALILCYFLKESKHHSDYIPLSGD
jgi:sugar phosphate permease